VLARLETQKGHSFLLQALPHVVSEFPRLRVIFVGDGALRAELEAQTDQLNLHGNVTFTGYQSNAAQWLSIADFTVLPSLYEGLPLVAIESLAAGKAVVGTAVDGTPEVVIHNKTGLLVPPADPQGLTAALQVLLRDRDLCERLGSAGASWVLENFTQEQQVRRTEDLYFKLLDEKTGRRLIRDAEQAKPVHSGERTVLTA